MNKKLVLIFMSVFLTLNLVGCGNDSSQSFTVATATEQNKAVYLSSLIDQLEGWNESFNSFSSLVGSPHKGTKEWLNKMALELVIMNILISDAADMEPTPEFKASHKAFLKGISYYKTIPENFPEAYDNNDNKLLEKIISDIKKGDKELEKSMSLLPTK